MVQKLLRPSFKIKCLLIVSAIYLMMSQGPSTVSLVVSSFKSCLVTETTLCLKHYFKNILLLVNFNEPFYNNIPVIIEMYRDVFPNIVFYGTNTSTTHNVIVVKSHKGYFSYITIAHAMRHYGNYTGYLLINDDVLINPWNLVRFDQNRIWEGPKWPITIGNYSKFDHWYWWKSRWGLDNCKKSLNEIEEFYTHLHYNTPISKKEIFMQLLHENMNNMNNNKNNTYNNIQHCHRGRSDIVYIPRIFYKDFMVFSKIFHSNKVFLEIAIPTMLRMIGLSKDFEQLKGVYLPGRVKTIYVIDSQYLWIQYSTDLDFIHPLKLHYGENSTINHLVLKTFIKRYINSVTKC